MARIRSYEVQGLGESLVGLILFCEASPSQGGRGVLEVRPIIAHFLKKLDF